jgi:hypothetical protein
MKPKQMRTKPSYRTYEVWTDDGETATVQLCANVVAARAGSFPRLAASMPRGRGPARNSNHFPARERRPAIPNSTMP